MSQRARTVARDVEWVVPLDNTVSNGAGRPRFTCRTLLLTSILLGLGAGLTITYRRSFFGQWINWTTPGGWGTITGVGTLVLGYGMRRLTADRAQHLIQTESGPIARAGDMQELVVRAAVEAAQQLLRSGQVTAAEIQSGAAEERIARLTAFKMIEAATLYRDCNRRDLIKYHWDDRLLFGNARLIPETTNYVRDDLNPGGGTAVNPVTLRQQFDRAGWSGRGQLRRQVIAGTAGAEWATMATVVRQRYFPSFRLGVHAGQVCRLIRPDGQPTHLRQLMGSVYSESAQRIVTEYRLTESQYEEHIDGFVTVLHAYSALRLLEDMALQEGHLLRLGSLSIDTSRPHELTWNDPEQGELVTDEAILIKNNLPATRDEAYGQLITELSRPLLVSLGREPPATNDNIRALATQLRKIGGLLNRQYSSALEGVMGRVAFFGGRTPSQAGAVVVQTVPKGLIPSRPHTQYFSNLPPVVPRKNKVIPNPIRPRDLIGGHVSNILQRHYETVDGHSGIPDSCMFDALSIALYGNDNIGNVMSLRMGVKRAQSDWPHLRVLQMESDEMFIFGGNLNDLQIISEILQRPVFVYLAENGMPMRIEERYPGLIFPHALFGEQYDAEPLVFMNSGNSHYYWCRPRFW
jgi:hypothetical protein